MNLSLNKKMKLHLCIKERQVQDKYLYARILFKYFGCKVLSFLNLLVHISSIFGLDSWDSSYGFTLFCYWYDTYFTQLSHWFITVLLGILRSSPGLFHLPRYLFFSKNSNLHWTNNALFFNQDSLFSLIDQFSFLSQVGVYLAFHILSLSYKRCLFLALLVLSVRFNIFSFWSGWLVFLTVPFASIFAQIR